VIGDLPQEGIAAGIADGERAAWPEQFDPQPIHTDRAFAEAGPFGGLIATDVLQWNGPAWGRVGTRAAAG
jgi:hypothetical protein